MLNICTKLVPLWFRKLSLRGCLRRRAVKATYDCEGLDRRVCERSFEETEVAQEQVVSGEALFFNEAHLLHEDLPGLRLHIPSGPGRGSDVDATAHWGYELLAPLGGGGSMLRSPQQRLGRRAHQGCDERRRHAYRARHAGHDAWFRPPRPRPASQATACSMRRPGVIWSPAHGSAPGVDEAGAELFYPRAARLECRSCWCFWLGVDSFLQQITDGS